MKLFRIIIDENEEGANNEEKFCNVMETYMGEYNLQLLSEFEEWSANEDELLGGWMMRVFNKKEKGIECLFVDDDDLANCIEYFVEDGNGIVHWKEEDKVEKDRVDDLAERIYKTLAPWDRADTSIEEGKEVLKNDPLSAIEYLLDIVENQ